MSMTEADLELISAGFTAILGFRVVPPSHGHGLPKLTVQELFNCTYIPVSLEDVDPGEVFDINVICINGCRMTVQVTANHTVANIKTDIDAKHDVPSRLIKLMFRGNRLQDHQTVGELGIPSGGRLYVMLDLKGGSPDYQLDIDQFDPAYNYDFTDEMDDGEVYYRGGEVYKRPYGWMRYAVKVLGQYEDDDWLGPDGIRTQEAQGEWPVSYHGTNMQAAGQIIKKGYRGGPRQAYGKGVYSSPSLDMVEQRYAQSFEFKGGIYKIALQNRINPDPGHLVIIPAMETKAGAEYWLSPKYGYREKNDDLRPYGILFKEVAKRRFR